MERNYTPEVERDRIGGAIELLRADRNLSEESLARQASIPVKDLIRIEEGEHPYPRDTINKVAAALGTTYDGLIQYSDEHILPLDPAEEERDVRETIEQLRTKRH